MFLPFCLSKMWGQAGPPCWLLSVSCINQFSCSFQYFPVPLLSVVQEARRLGSSSGCPNHSYLTPAVGLAVQGEGTERRVLVGVDPYMSGCEKSKHILGRLILVNAISSA